MGQLSITLIDVLVVLVIFVSAGFAMWRGLISETFSIFEWVAAAYLALRFTPTFQPLLRDAISPPWLAGVAAFAGVFLIVFIPLSIFAHRLSDVVKKSEIGPVDRALGMVFGVLRGLVIVGLAYIAFAALVPVQDHPAALTDARLFPLIRDTSDVLLSIVPERGGQGGGRGGAGGTQVGAEGPDAAITPAAAEGGRGDGDNAGAARGGGGAAGGAGGGRRGGGGGARGGGAGGGGGAAGGAANTQAASPQAGKTYGAGDRGALDRLIETNGGRDGTR
jgi:membrane protein required for colicin V production